MKNKITCLLAGAALFGATANAEIVLTDELSAYGYIDLSVFDDEGDGNTTTDAAEFELGFAFTPLESKWSAVAEISFDGDQGGVDSDQDDADWETVTISYQYSDTLSFTFGNILSYQGFEAFDATGLYQFSYAGPANTPLYSANYAIGASADGSLGDFDYGVWVGESTVADEPSDSSYEYLLAYNGIENLTVKVIVADDPNYDTTNVWASYDYGDFTFAVEHVDTDYVPGAGEADLEVTMGMIYYAMGDAGITFRYAEGEIASGFAGAWQDYEKFTISPSYAFSDNVFGLIEFSTEELGNGANNDADTAAVELIYSF